MSEFPPYTFYTSILILLCAMYKSCKDTHPVFLSSLFLGLTSILHHSRMHEWHIYDVITCLDFTAVFANALVGAYYCGLQCRSYGIMCMYCLTAWILIQLSVVKPQYYAICHATIHIVFIFYLLNHDSTF